MSFPRSVLRAVGSLWFAAVLLVLLLVAMACATVVESTDGTERALADFYTDWWFKALLALVGVNVLAAMLLRFPFTRRHIGFVLTHGGIIVTLLGALVTQHHGVNGRVALAEGESADQFTAGGETLALARGPGEPASTIMLGG